MAQPALGVQIKTEMRCKICTSEHRSEIEDILAIRSAGGTLPDGTRPTEEWIFSVAEERWGFKLNRNNIGTHFRKHFKAGDPAAMESVAVDVRTKLEGLIRDAGIPHIAAEVFLEGLVGIGYQKMLADPSSVTIDQALKAVAELTKRKHEETTANLMVALGQSVQTAIGKIPDPDPLNVPPGEIEVVDVVEEA